MHVFNLAVIILSVLFVANSQLINDDSAIENINQLRPGWEAGHNKRFENVTHEQAGRLLGLNEIPVRVSTRVARDVSAAQGLPDTFDARSKWPACVMPIRDQQNCGACWAFAGSSSFGQRMCIQSNGAVKIDMSPQVSINCNTAQNGCNGGTLGGTWEYFKTTGTVADSAYPYTAKKSTCSVSTGTKRYYVSSYSRPSTVADMQTAIYNGGSVQVGLDVYSDFYNYKSGVYRRTSNTLSGGHSVYLIGWGTEGGVAYWLAVNSWGTSWGQSGVFKIRRGTNECNIEKGYLPVYGVIASSSIPTGTTKAPTTTTRAPTTTTKAPTTTTRAPAATTKAPVTTTTTRAPTTKAPSTSAPARNCWTCFPGYVHWYDVPGMAEPSDKCACVVAQLATNAPTTTTRAPSTTTKAPSTSAPVRDCWTCYPGYVHWYDIPGMAEPADKCACVVASLATTRAPAATTTTRAPAATTKAPSTSAPVRNCWTCPAGYIHWFNVPGMAEPADKCACVVNSNARNCWTCPAGYVHWYDIAGMAEPSDKCACVPKP